MDVGGFRQSSRATGHLTLSDAAAGWRVDPGASGRSPGAFKGCEFHAACGFPA